MLTIALPVPEESYQQVVKVKPFCLSSPEPLGDTPSESKGTNDDFWGPSGSVSLEVVDEEQSLYR